MKHYSTPVYRLLAVLRVGAARLAEIGFRFQVEAVDEVLFHRDQAVFELPCAETRYKG